jgi:dihydroorotase
LYYTERLVNILITNGHIVDPSQEIDGIGDILIEEDRIKEIVLRPRTLNAISSSFEIIDATNLYVLPGLVDMHCHLREPGFSHKETIRTGTLAALKGGFTTLCCMPNTNPVNDNETVTEFILRKAYAEGACYVYPIGAITKGQKGEELAEMGNMHSAGCVAFSDDGRPVMNSLIMRRALEYSKAFNMPVISHPEDINLSEGGVMNEGIESNRLGLKGIPDEAEEIMIARDIMLAGLTGGRLHIAHVSTRRGVELIRRAKEEGLNVSAETCPHYFSLTEAAVSDYNTDAKVNPPLRTEEDINAIIEGLRDGTIDVIATDHAPHHRDEKLQEFDKAPSGISGLETALSLSLKLVHDGRLSLKELIKKLSFNPAKIVGIPKGTLRPGTKADILIVDIKREFRVEAERFLSLGKNTPFDRWLLKGMAIMTICKGVIHKWI